MSNRRQRQEILMYKVIVAGSRSINPSLYLGVVDYELEQFEGIYEEVEFVTGCCPEGPDQIPFMLREYRKGYGLPEINIKEFPANWEKYGRRAGMIRNNEMAEYADYLIAIWDGRSRGTKNMIKQMVNHGKPMLVIVP